MMCELSTHCVCGVGLPPAKLADIHTAETRSGTRPGCPDIRREADTSSEDASRRNLKTLISVRAALHILHRATEARHDAALNAVSAGMLRPRAQSRKAPCCAVKRGCDDAREIIIASDGGPPGQPADRHSIKPEHPSSAAAPEGDGDTSARKGGPSNPGLLMSCHFSITAMSIALSMHQRLFHTREKRR